MRRALLGGSFLVLFLAALASGAAEPKSAEPAGLLDRVGGFLRDIEEKFMRWSETAGADWLECAIVVPIGWFNYEPGDYLTMSRLGWFYEAGPCFFRDPERAATLYRPRADAGEDAAAFLLGRLYLLGLGVPKDADRAKKLFELGALHWLHAPRSAEAYLKNRMLWRREVPPELADAIRRMRALDAAEYFRLAEAVFNGTDGMPRNLKLARTLYESVGHWSGSDLAIQYAVARRLLDGSLPLRKGEDRRNQLLQGLERLFYVAIMVVKEPVVARARQEIARYVEEGRGVEKDPFFAFEFYTLAQKSGLDTAADIERVRAQLTPENIAEAEADIRTHLYQVKPAFHRKFRGWN